MRHEQNLRKIKLKNWHQKKIRCTLMSSKVVHVGLLT